LKAAKKQQNLLIIAPIVLIPNDLPYDLSKNIANF